MLLYDEGDGGIFDEPETLDTNALDARISYFYYFLNIGFNYSFIWLLFRHKSLSLTVFYTKYFNGIKHTSVSWLLLKSNFISD